MASAEVGVSGGRLGPAEMVSATSVVPVAVDVRSPNKANESICSVVPSDTSQRCTIASAVASSSLVAPSNPVARHAVSSGGNKSMNPM